VRESDAQPESVVQEYWFGAGTVVAPISFSGNELLGCGVTQLFPSLDGVPVQRCVPVQGSVLSEFDSVSRLYRYGSQSQTELEESNPAGWTSYRWPDVRSKSHNHL
jgi:hypothetical protein